MMAKRTRGRCLVCDDVAIGVNFGVTTCMPCKAFFRRNAVKLGVQTFVCQNDGDCLISHTFRRACNCCRLAKCFRVGMNKTLIMSDTERENRNQLVQSNRKKRGKLPKQQDQQSLLSPLPLSRPPKPVQCLSPSDQMILSNIFHAYENTCIALRNARFPYYPSVPHTTIHGLLNEFTCLFRISVAYLTHIPEFQCRSMHDRVRLVKNHFAIIANINASLMHPLPHNNLIVSWRNLFGLDLTRRLLKRNDALQQYIHDPILLKIVLIILVLSSGISRSVDGLDVNEVYTDPLYILNAQNVYVELLWRYILLRCGNEKDTVKFVTNLIVFILHVQDLDLDMDEYISNRQSEIKQMTPLMQTMWPTTDETDSVDKNDTWQNPIS